MSRLLLLLLCCAIAGVGQIDGDAAYRRFLDWLKAPPNAALQWEAATARYAAKLEAEGLSAAEASKIVSIISSRDEAALYDPIFAGATPGKFQTSPSELLVEAIRGHVAGRALDVGMGQGRNSLYLAQNGWDVTGFDVAKAGLAAARRQAAKLGVKIRTVHASDEEFDFGTAQWDLIAILYPIEKRSVLRVRQALKPGGVVVVECSHKEASNAPFEYDTNELLRIFEGFRIVKYEDSVRQHEWAAKPLRMVRLIAQK